MMVPNANLNFTLDTTVTLEAGMPSPIVWGYSSDEWVMPAGDGVIGSRPYLRNGAVVLTWEPWGMVLVHHSLPVNLAPKEGSMFWLSTSMAFGMSKSHPNREDVARLYNVGLEIVCHALPMLAEAAPELLTPAIVESIENHGVTKGEYLCRTSSTPGLSSASTPKTPAATGRRRKGGKET